MSKSQVRRSKRGGKVQSPATRKAARSVYKVPLLLLVALLTLSDAGVAQNSRPVPDVAETFDTATIDSPNPKLSASFGTDAVTLTEAQQQTILTEADDLYTRAAAVIKTDSAEAADLFTASATKYQLLVDSGIHNALLYRNLGNAYLQSNQLGRAIANYERATRYAPHDRQLAANLELANSLVEGDLAQLATVEAVGASTSLASIIDRLRTYNRTLTSITGARVITWLLVTSSLLFWGLHIARAVGCNFLRWKYSIVPLLLLVTTLTSVTLATTEPSNPDNGIIVANQVTLHSGDGENFDTIQTLKTAQGHRVQILATRGLWTQIKTHHGQIGWVKQIEVETLSAD